MNPGGGGWGVILEAGHWGEGVWCWMDGWMEEVINDARYELVWFGAWVGVWEGRWFLGWARGLGGGGVIELERGRSIEVEMCGFLKPIW